MYLGHLRRLVDGKLNNNIYLIFKYGLNIYKLVNTVFYHVGASVVDLGRVLHLQLQTPSVKKSLSP